MFETWVEKCGRGNNIDYDCAVYVCSLHFEDKFVGKRKLLKGAFPSINLVAKENNEDYCSPSTSNLRTYEPASALFYTLPKKSESTEDENKKALKFEKNYN